VTQYWPSADPFTFSPTGFSTGGGYLTWIGKHRPWNTDPLYSAGGTGFGLGTSAFGTVSQLYSGWFNQSAASPNAAAVSTGANTPTLWKPTAFWRRGFDLLDCKVSASFQAQSDDPNYLRANGAKVLCGVGARIQPNTLTDGLDRNLCRTSGGDGYWAFVENDTTIGLGIKFVLVRVNGGTVTRLADSPIGATTFTAWSALPLDFARTISLSVQTVGPKVVLRVYTAELAKAPHLVFEVIDSSASRITGSGMPGLLMGSEYFLTLSPPRQVATCVNYWECTDVAGTTIQFRDEWRRLAPNFCTPHNPTLSVGAQAMRTGTSLMSAWTGDMQASDATPWLWPDDSSGLNNRVSVPLLGGHPDWMLSQRNADSVTEQERSVVLVFDSAGAASGNERYGGVALRFTLWPGPLLIPAACYAAILYVRDSDSTAHIDVVRWFNGSSTVLARKTGVAYVQDSGVTIGLQVETVPISGFARLKVTRNGTQVVMGSLAVPGIDINASGTIVDSSSSLVTLGAGEAIICQPDGSSRAMFVDSWTQGAGSGPPPDTNNQASIEVTAEYSATVGTLTLPLSAVASLRYVDPRIMHEMESGHRYIGRRAHYARRVWTVSADGATLAEKDALLALLALTRGVEKAIDWTPIGRDQVPCVVAFLNDTIDVDEIAKNVFAVHFELQELRLQDGT
jgi:hypothetical protein